MKDVPNEEEQVFFERKFWNRRKWSFSPKKKKLV